MSIDWSKAPVGFPIWLEDVRPSRLSAGDHDRSSWACDAQGEYTLYCLGGSRGWWTKSREGIDFVVHRQPEPWNGEGLPPVGAVCEISINSAIGKWRECTIVAHDNGRAVYRHHNGEYDVYGAAEIGTPHLRPIRTAEQIATEERAKEVTHMVGFIRERRMSVSTPENPKQEAVLAAEALYDAGFRRAVQ